MCLYDLSFAEKFHFLRCIAAKTAFNMTMIMTMMMMTMMMMMMMITMKKKRKE